MWVIAWPLFGALIGVAAAQRKGFSVAGGILGGLLMQASATSTMRGHRSPWERGGHSRQHDGDRTRWRNNHRSAVTSLRRDTGRQSLVAINRSTQLVATRR